MKIQNHSYKCLIASGCLILIALVMTLLGLGFRLGLDFSGGCLIRLDMGQAFEQADVAMALKNQGIAAYSLAVSGENGQILQIRVPELEDAEEISALQAGLEAAFAENYPDLNAPATAAGLIGPAADITFLLNAFICLLFAIAFILVYFIIRFDIRSGIVAVVSLLHDWLIVASFMVILRGVLRVNASFAAVMLVVTACSVYNLYILFNRIRENRKLPACRNLSRGEIVTLSIGQNCGRTVSTLLITLLLFGTLSVIGAEAIREISLPIIIGAIASAYSTNMISGYLWALLRGRAKTKKKAKKA